MVINGGRWTEVEDESNFQFWPLNVIVKSVQFFRRTVTASSSDQKKSILSSSMKSIIPRANVFFKHFDLKSPADRILVYLTFYINLALKRLEGCRTVTEGTNAIKNLGFEHVHVPGESEVLRDYFKQIREETSRRLLNVAYRGNGTPNKWWLAFAKHYVPHLYSGEPFGFVEDQELMWARSLRDRGVQMLRITIVDILVIPRQNGNNFSNWPGD
ncbi:ARP2/3 complex, 21kDa subunit (p21-Arc) [Cynara cardunculus var. scolymus]|uniref:ARP2/3 complex, 21kDa subunit (p21-Arc) n=1 Tax=Cynara cardunculus var. scolymus TaxID=59895 RepID=A0A103Y2J7_CYNCS|nr:ARP2/3 complex, 21kDa subunit (p21-Arc) [Cynara cardunculus var. scolymus]